MGDHGDQARPGGSLLPNGLLPSSAAAGVGRALGDVGRWARAEERTAELIARIQPSGPSEERRNAVSNYVQRLIMKCFSCRVFTFGSVPLKTYLPDGDIDLTAFSENDKLKDTWANEVRDALENEEKNENAEFRVKEVQYIQAEVKIIKCLVEDIVVDISFNQVGGLCTLCFLDEIDSLINQNHLFKQSIILIKAWCYYESRILGAHHGLISTYALETLVLYIFNVYNNSFAGPLEVLYRFLEFFSNFDWEKFCVSLWGPVPISSLPDMTAEAPRKDDGELLLNKLFLDICSALYSVFPAGQENQGQPFVSKYFNIVDPLRINNNLGRSVSKGNFFRIRSAFTFGARRLARLLECPEGNLIAEVNQFFTNTWARHASGNCPDAPSPNLWHLRPSKCASDEDSNNSKGTSTFKKKSDNNALLVGHEYEVDGHLSFHGPTPKVLRTKNQQFQRIYRTSISPAVYHDQNQKSYGSQINSNVSDYIENAITSRVSAHTHNNEKHLRPDHFVNEQEGQNSFQFTGTHSSPELAVTDISAEALVRGNCNKVPEAGRNQNVRKLDHDGRIKNFDFDDPSPSKDYMPDQILESTDSHDASNSFHDSEEHIALVSETLEMYQKGQDLVNMMASSRASNVNEQVQLPRYLPSHVPLPLSSALIDSVAYNHRNLGGIVPSCIPMTDPSWGSNMQNPQSSMPSHLSHYSPTSGQNMESEDTVGSVYGGSSMTDMNLDDDEQGFWYEDEAGSQRSNPDNGGFQKLHSQGKKQPTQGESNVFSSSRACNSGAFVIRGHNKFAREHKGSVRRDDNGAFEYQTSRGNDIHSTVRNGNIGPFPVSKAVYPGSKPASECSVDGSDKPPKSTRDRRGKKLSTSMILTALYGKSRSRLQPEGSSNHTSSQTDDEASTHDRNHELPGRELAEVNELAEVSGSNSLVPLAPMHVSAPHKRVLENSVVAPYEFYPTGPPVPFLAMLPVYNFPSDTRRSGGSPGQLDCNERLDHDHTSLSSSYLRNATPEPPEEHKSDILNSDFSSHWQNLQYGRSCQNTRHLGPVIYPSPVVVPPVYLQGHFPWGGPGRPLSANLNPSSQIMSYGPPVVPVSPLQPGPGTSVFQHLGDQGPRYRGGTGTYLPNPKASPRDRLSSSTKNHRGNYNHNQNDHNREENWNTSKLQAAGRSHERTPAEKPTSRPDRSSANDNRTNRPWTKHRHESRDMYQAAQTSSFVSTNSLDSSLNMSHGTYPLAAVNSNGMHTNRPALPSAVKLYSYDQGVPYSSHSEPSEYGFLRLLNLSGGDEIARSGDENPAREDYQHMHGAYQGSSRSYPG